MNLYFLRHGEAGGRDRYRGDDFSRPLTDDGRERMAREAKTIALMEIAPDVILTSPLVRARQTAEIVADRLKARDRLLEDERLGPDFEMRALAQIVKERVGAQALLFVGHDPSMSQTIGELIGGASIVLKKGGLACVRAATAESSKTLNGELTYLVSPRILML